jgi:hypothetical protein
MTCLSRLAMVLLVAASAASAQDAEFSRQSLKGLNGVGVVVESLRAEMDQVGLNRTSIQTDVELKLRQAGVTVLTRAEVLAAPGGPYLYIIVNTTTSTGALYAYVINVQLLQDIRLDRDPSIRIIDTATWSVAGFGTVLRNNLRNVIRDTIKDRVDIFLNAYLSVNPRK